MKISGYLVLLTGLILGTVAQANVVAPSVNGMVQQVSGNMITMNGHTYHVTADTKVDPAVGPPQPGQQVKLFLSSDGSTVTVISPVTPTATH